MRKGEREREEGREGERYKEREEWREQTEGRVNIGGIKQCMQVSKSMLVTACSFGWVLYVMIISSYIGIDPGRREYEFFF